MSDPRPAAPSQAQTAVPPLGRLRGFHPGWFGAVMGTAIVGIVGYQNPGNLADLKDPAHSFGVLMVAVATILAIALGLPYIVRWLRHPAAAIADLRNPVAGALYGTFPGGLLVSSSPCQLGGSKPPTPGSAGSSSSRPSRPG